MSIRQRAIVNSWHTGVIVRCRCRIVIIDLYFDPTLGCELRHNNWVRDLFKECWVSLSSEPVVERMKVSSSNDIIEVNRLEYLSTTLRVLLERKAPTSFELKVKGSGARLGPLQKGCPVFVTASLGKLYSNCRIELLYLSSNCNRAQTMHSSNEIGLFVTRYETICSTCSVCWPECLRVLSKKLGSDKYWLTDSAGLTNNESNSWRLHYGKLVWSMTRTMTI